MGLRFDAARFFAALKQSFGTAPTESQKRGLRELLGFFATDPLLTDIRHAAYALATVKHETAHTFAPIAEYGRGRGHAYGLQVRVTDASGVQRLVAFFGRGYCQLTWRENYAKFGRLLGIDLIGNPALALRADVAYRVMMAGMRGGLFRTGHNLARYIAGTHCDYYGGRAMINGSVTDPKTGRRELDCGYKIAGYARAFEAALRAALIDEDSPASAQASPAAAAPSPTPRAAAAATLTGAVAVTATVGSGAAGAIPWGLVAVALVALLLLAAGFYAWYRAGRAR